MSFVLIRNLCRDMLLTPKIEKAIKRASEIHDGKRRKIEHNLPYISHLFSVAVILSTFADDEDLLVAGLLHNSLEGTSYTMDELSYEFGSIVAKTVEQVTEIPEKEAPWKERKLKYLEGLKSADARALMVAAADKLHNLRGIIEDYKKHGGAVFEKFSATASEELWVFTSVLEILEERLLSPIVPEYRKAVLEAKEFFGVL